MSDPDTNQRSGLILEAIISRVIEDEVLQIDRKHFIACTLVNCILEYRGGEVIFERTLMRGCKHVFYGRAKRTVHYLQGTGLMPFNAVDWAEFSDRVQ